MKKIKVLSCILVLILFLALFSGCGEMTPEKIMKLPADYTLEHAQKDGMIYVPSDGVSDEKIQKINDFFGQYGETGSSGKSEKYLYLIDENRLVTMFTAEDGYAARQQYSIPEKSGTGFLCYANAGVRETEDGFFELYLYNTEEDEADSILTKAGEKTVYFYSE